ncbi:NADPH oxidase organizer 1 NADPH oxidase regulatory protein [Channa argus]|uniref:NADPH oxidase organizer 1 NADPH oxidase regulatory protein n=1 Tax=Channa argus TaxID=215402 RepID=A0A6G1QQX0_CHAAH|nr:NADPH oxidase organizer 1 NADPH oxidase regulatory protein [Channa argus]KAK2884991.1 hypothetical protein Q8A73_021465 [Channa argus]
MAADQRFVISARIIGAVRRDAPKLKVFMISVFWSDESEVIIYRSFRDFKKFHKQLKRRFPHLNPLRKNDRMIPKFMGKARRNSLQQKGSKRSVLRMKFLESYCDKLLKCDQTVTRTSEVTQFFIPKDHDLQPDFTKNSIMIMLSDDQGDGLAGGGGVSHKHAGNITQPFVTQTYRCVAAYETKDVKNRPFKVAVDEKLDVLIKDPAGWWLVESEDRRLAWFPAPYLVLDGEDDDDDEEDEIQLKGALYCAVRSYTANKNDEVSVPIGSVVDVLRKSDNGWWFIRFNGKAGYIPSMYLQPYNNPRTGLFNLQRKMHSSSLNLTTSREPQATFPSSINEETNPERDFAGEPTVPGRLQKARSLDALSETLSQRQPERDAATSDGRIRSMSNTSADSSFSGFSSSSESSSSLKEEEQSLSDRRGSNISTQSFASVSSQSSDTASVAPRVPVRPKTEEILTRCTTMTRKAALATKARLQIEPEPIHSR